MTDPYSPSPELVEAVADLSGCGTDTTEFVIGEAVDFRHPDGRPELVPWEQVRELVDAAREAEPWLDYLDTNHAPDWAPNEASVVANDLARLRAALAPFTQEPER